MARVDYPHGASLSPTSVRCSERRQISGSRSVVGVQLLLVGSEVAVSAAESVALHADALGLPVVTSPIQQCSGEVARVVGDSPPGRIAPVVAHDRADLTRPYADDAADDAVGGNAPDRNSLDASQHVLDHEFSVVTAGARHP